MFLQRMFSYRLFLQSNRVDVITAYTNRKMRVPGAVEYSGLYGRSAGTLPPPFPFTTALIRGHPVFLFSQAGDDDPSSIIDSAARYRFFANGSRQAYSSVPETTQRPLADSSEWVFAQTPSRCYSTLKCRCAGNVQISMYVHRRRIPASRQVARNNVGFIANRFFL